VFASIVIVAGVSTAVYTFTRLGQFILAGELMDALGRRRMRSELEKLEGHFIICGYGRIGQPVAEGMKRDQLPFCVVDRDTEHEEEMRSRGYIRILGDATDEEVLKEAGIDRAATLLALLPSDADNLYLTITAKSMNPAIRVIARGRDERAEMKLKRGGADRVVSPYLMAAARVLSAAVKPMVVEFMELVTPRQYLPLRLEEIAVAETSPLGGRSLAETGIRSRFGVIVVAIKKGTGEMKFNPDPGLTIVPGDVLIAMGEEQDLEKLERTCTGNA
jgi:voltage-gated potassium channel